MIDPHPPRTRWCQPWWHDLDTNTAPLRAGIWTKWDGKRRIRAVTGSVFAPIPGMPHGAMTAIEEERATAAAACVAGDTTSATWRTAASH